METKYKINEWVFHRFGDEIKHGKIVGYDDDCYIIKTLVDDIFGYMHLKDEDISKSYEELRINIMEVKINNNGEMLDATIEMVDGVMVVSPKKVKFEPKDGDVVYSGGFYDFVFIYKDNLTEEAYYYVSLFLKDNRIELPDGGHIGYVSQLRPATEEEKQKLFDRLKEEGYEWKPETKELVKLKWKPKEGEEFWFPLYYASPSEFKPITSLLNKGRDKAILEKGWCFKTKEECQEFCNKLNQAINSVEL